TKNKHKNTVLFMKKLLQLLAFLVMVPVALEAQFATCPTQLARNNGNNTSACPTTTSCGTSGTRACDVVGTSWDYTSCCTGTYNKKTSDIQYQFPDLTNPSQDPVMRKVYVVSSSTPIDVKMGPPM